MTHPRGEHFKLVHALRGIAALWVVLFHLSEGGHIDRLKAGLPRLMVLILDHGDLGVAIFFALSGFVIAHSIRDADVTPSYIGRFALRRSIRLDPSYWASLLFMALMGWLSATIKGEPVVPASMPQVVSHIFYVQTLLGYEQINSVYWTLTFEVQFYLAFVILILAAQKLRMPPLLMVALPFAVTAFAWAEAIPPVPGLFTSLWHCFLAGVLAYWAKDDGKAVAALAVLCVATLIIWPTSFSIVSMVTAVGLYFGFRTGYLFRGLDWRGLQFLGTISYSLYLIHNPVTGAASFLVARLTGSEALVLVSGVAASIAAAWAFWLIFERPSMDLAHRIELGRRRDGAAAAAVPPL